MLYFWMSLTAAAIVAADQLLKYWVVQSIPYGGIVPILDGVIHLTYVRNTGAAFSILAGQRWFFLLVTFLFLGFIILVFKKKWFPAPMARWALTLLTGGAVGNLIDRVAAGGVVDMFELEFIRFAVFNLADLFITAGCILLCVWVIFFDKKDAQASVPSPEDSPSSRPCGPDPADSGPVPASPSAKTLSPEDSPSSRPCGPDPADSDLAPASPSAKTLSPELSSSEEVLQQEGRQ